MGERTAANVRAELARRNISGHDMARDLGWPNTSTWRRLRGVKSMTVDEIVEVADYLGVPVSTLIDVGPGTVPGSV